MELYKYLPPDPTPEEMKMVDAVVSKVYEKLEDPADKFILAYCFHLGFGKEETARALGVSHVTVWKRIRKIKKVLGNGRPKYTVKETTEVHIV